MKRSEIFEKGKRKLREKIELMYGWGRWSGLREFKRGAFHMSTGVVGWVLIHPLQVRDEIISILLLIVALSFLVLDEIRLAIIRIDLSKIPKWCRWFFRLLKWIEKKLVREEITRETEINQRTTIVQSVLGLSFAWIIAPRWVAVFAGLLFSFVDTFAKLGYYWPVKRFEDGRAKGKSVGGMIIGWIVGLICGIWVVIFHLVSVPLFPASISIFQVIVVYVIGIVAAPIIELYSGKLDNLFIPSCSALFMVFFNVILSLLQGG